MLTISKFSIFVQNVNWKTWKAYGEVFQRKIFLHLAVQKESISTMQFKFELWSKKNYPIQNDPSFSEENVFIEKNYWTTTNAFLVEKKNWIKNYTILQVFGTSHYKVFFLCIPQKKSNKFLKCVQRSIQFIIVFFSTNFIVEQFSFFYVVSKNHWYNFMSLLICFCSR